MRLRQILAVLGVLSAVILPALPAHAQPSADQVLSDFGLSADDKQRVLNGEFVTPDLSNVSDRDLAVAVVFLVKTTPESLAKQIITGDLITQDPQVQAHGRFSTTGSLADLAGLKIGNNAAQALAGAQPGESLNLGTGEIAAFNAVPGGAPPAIQAQLQTMLLARYQAYRTSGLPGIVPYDRGSGRTLSVGDELRKASQAAKGLEKYMPGLHAVLLDFPTATAPGLQHDFRWVQLRHSAARRPSSWCTCWRPPTAPPGPSSSGSTTSAPDTTPTRRCRASCPCRGGPWSSTPGTRSPIRSPGSAGP